MQDLTERQCVGTQLDGVAGEQTYHCGKVGVHCQLAIHQASQRHSHPLHSHQLGSGEAAHSCELSCSGKALLLVLSGLQSEKRHLEGVAIDGSRPQEEVEGTRPRLG
jgi:hypothetical protein